MKLFFNWEYDGWNECDQLINVQLQDGTIVPKEEADRLIKEGKAVRYNVGQFWDPMGPDARWDKEKFQWEIIRQK